MVKIKEKHMGNSEHDLKNDKVIDDQINLEQSNELINKLAAAERKAEENYEKFLRVSADLENYKKRAAKEKTDAIAFGNEVLIRDMLPIIDSLDRATEQACNASDMEAFREGFKLVKDQMLCCLAKHGVEKIDAVGEQFDPHLHDALMQVDSEEQKNNKVIEEFEKGYMLKGRLLKPAKVSVGKHMLINEKVDFRKQR